MIKAYVFSVLVVVVFYQTTIMAGGLPLTRSTSKKFMKFLPNSVESLDRLVIQGGDAIKAKSYDKLVQMFKDKGDTEALKVLTKDANIMSFNYKNSSASIKSTKNLWGFKQGYDFADKCILVNEGNSAEVYQCLKWKAALLETDIFEGNSSMNASTLRQLKDVLTRMDTLKEKYGLSDDPFVTYLKGRLICEIKLATEDRVKIVQLAKEYFYGNVINHKQETIQSCIDMLEDFESKASKIEEQLVESKLLLGKAYLEEQQWKKAKFWLEEAVDMPVRDTKGYLKNTEARKLLEKLQLDYYSTQNIFL